jgi:hypothetical protein
VSALLVALVLAQPAAGPSLVRVTCQTDCSVKVAGQRGRRVTSQKHEFDGVTPGRNRFEIEGFAGISVAAVSLDLPAASEVDVSLKGERFRIEATKPRATAAADAAAAPGKPAGKPSVMRVSCQQPCTVLVDGKKRTGELQVGTLLLGSVEPGPRVVTVKFLAASAVRTIDVPAASDVTLAAQDSVVRVVKTTPVP